MEINLITYAIVELMHGLIMIFTFRLSLSCSSSTDDMIDGLTYILFGSSIFANAIFYPQIAATITITPATRTATTNRVSKRHNFVFGFVFIVFRNNVRTYQTIC
uniref:Uncharacterized protein n=1 Tax=Glossina palpalis gambiensis TaxID=67801 RepID=A0A1B0AXD1_9MUSC